MATVRRGAWAPPSAAGLVTPAVRKTATSQIVRQSRAPRPALLFQPGELVAFIPAKLPFAIRFSRETVPAHRGSDRVPLGGALDWRQVRGRVKRTFRTALEWFYEDENVQPPELHPARICAGCRPAGIHIYPHRSAGRRH